MVIERPDKTPFVVNMGQIFSLLLIAGNSHQVRYNPDKY
jgi:hypothetical protein